MRSAFPVSTTRTPIGRADRGGFNETQSQALAGHAIARAVRRAGVDPADVEDVVIGAALQQGSQGGNIARQAVPGAGLPGRVAGMSVDRASGLMAIAGAAKQIIEVTAGGGLESVFLVQTNAMNRTRARDRGAISIGHPYGMSGTRMTSHALTEGNGVRYITVTMCVGEGMGAAGRFEVA